MFAAELGVADDAQDWAEGVGGGPDGNALWSSAPPLTGRPDFDADRMRIGPQRSEDTRASVHPNLAGTGKTETSSSSVGAYSSPPGSTTRPIATGRAPSDLAEPRGSQRGVLRREHAHKRAWPGQAAT